MKRVLFLTLFISVSSLVCKGQEYPDISFEEVESSREYVNGNVLQKDLPLYSKTFELSHPYYADKKHVKALRKQTKKLYKEFAEIDDIKTFRCGHFTRPNENQNNEIELVPDVVLNLSDYTMDKDPAWEWIIKNHTL